MASNPVGKEKKEITIDLEKVDKNKISVPTQPPMSMDKDTLMINALVDLNSNIQKMVNNQAVIQSDMNEMFKMINKTLETQLTPLKALFTPQQGQQTQQGAQNAQGNGKGQYYQPQGQAQGQQSQTGNAMMILINNAIAAIAQSPQATNALISKLVGMDNTANSYAQFGQRMFAEQAVAAAMDRRAFYRMQWRQGLIKQNELDAYEKMQDQMYGPMLGGNMQGGIGGGQQLQPQPQTQVHQHGNTQATS